MLHITNIIWPSLAEVGSPIFTNGNYPYSQMVQNISQITDKTLQIQQKILNYTSHIPQYTSDIWPSLAEAGELITPCASGILRVKVMVTHHLVHITYHTSHIHVLHHTSHITSNWSYFDRCMHPFSHEGGINPFGGSKRFNSFK